jgi:hypothetical protein
MLTDHRSAHGGRVQRYLPYKIHFIDPPAAESAVIYVIEIRAKSLPHRNLVTQRNFP